MRDQSYFFDEQPFISEFDGDVMPAQCTSLYNDARVKENYVFGESSAAGYIIIGLTAILYATCLIYIFVNRKGIAFHSRSPKLLMIGIVVLCSDTILNTLIFSSGTGG